LTAFSTTSFVGPDGSSIAEIHILCNEFMNVSCNKQWSSFNESFHSRLLFSKVWASLIS
jgi:hypothetical protein